MRAIHRFIGCTLFIACIGSAAATSAETQDLSGATPGTLESGSASSGASSGGDVAGLNHDCASSNEGGSSSSSTQGSSHHSGGGTVVPSPSRRPHLGWQSLLPGSIQ